MPAHKSVRFREPITSADKLQDKLQDKVQDKVQGKVQKKAEVESPSANSPRHAVVNRPSYIQKKGNGRFKALTKFIIVLLRSWKIHSDKVREVLNLYQTLHLIAESTQGKNLLFDITQYRSNKEAKTSAEVKRILKKPPKERTREELHFVQVLLRNYKSISDFPDRMQKGIALKGRYQEFDAKRVLVRESHVPMYFYFILSGSAVVTMTDTESHQERTVVFLRRGDSFGEESIINKTPRPSTVISKDKVELLALTNEDFIDIFMSGGLSNISEAFLKGVSCLDGWPRELLHTHPKKAVLNYFKKGTVVVKDSKDNEWIVIVITGSCSMLTKLQRIKPKRKKITSTVENWRERMVTSLKSESYLNHEERMQLFYEQQIKHLTTLNQRMRIDTLPEINVKIYDEVRPESKSATFLTLALGQGHTSKTKRRSSIATSGPTARDMPIGILKKKNKGPFLVPSREGSPEPQALADQRASTAPTGLRRPSKQSVTTVTPSTSKDSAGSGDDGTVFINVQTLTKGAVFGITDLFYDDQPRFILTSNGVECLLINKKFFLDHSSNDFIVKLRDETLPYPTEAELQRNLEEKIIWNHHKKQTVSGVIREIRARRPRMHFRSDKRTGFSF